MALVEGQVVDHESGDALPGATVSLAAGPSAAVGQGTRVTDAEGRFSFADVPWGAYRLQVSAEGYHPMSDTLDVDAHEGVSLILPLSREPVHLEPILVGTEASPAVIPGVRRPSRQRGSAFLVTREDIARRRPRYITELLHGVPGGMVVPASPGYTLLLRDQCRPGIWVDGVELVGARGIDQLVSPQEVERVEVYHGHELPVEFGVNTCGGVLIWTRRGTTPPPGAVALDSGSTLTRILGAAALIGLLWYLIR